MDIAEVIQSKQVLEKNIKTLVTKFKIKNSLSEVGVDIITRNIYMDGSVGSFCQILDVVVTAKVNESGTEIVIK